MEEILKLNSILLALTGTGLVGIFLKIYKALKKQADQQEKRLDAIEQAIQSILKDRLYNECKKAINTDYITINQLQNINAMYCNYIALGGNSFIQSLYDRVQSLKVVKGGV